MKLLLITSVVCFAAVLAAPADKQKREILPGDPRYGTDYHHHHHHHDHDNEVQISKAVGGYVGSTTVPEETEDHSLQVQSLTSYGPPNYTPSKPLGSDYAASSDVSKNTVQVPATSYGIPDILINNNYVEPAAEEKLSAPLTILQTNLNTDYQAPSVEAPITSYFANHEEHVHPQTSYGTEVKTTVYEHPQIESVHVQKTVPEVHHEVHHVQPAEVHKETVSVPNVQVKATTSHLPVKTQGVQHSVSSLPSYASSISSSFPNYFYSSYPSYPSYSSYSNIPVRTVDHRVQVQVPQPYPVPVTKQVTYPVAVPHAVEVPKPYYVRVAQPVQVTVNRPYAVEVPRAVPYPVPQYVRTNVPVYQQQHLTTLDAKASNPIEGFFENAQSSFQNVIGNLPSFPNPFENFQNPFPNFELPSFPGLPSFSPQVTQTPAPATGNNINVPAATSTDSIAIDNPVLKTTVTKTVQPVVTHHAKLHQTTQFKPATTCAGCSVSATHISTKQKEHVHSTDANDGYNY